MQEGWKILSNESHLKRRNNSGPGSVFLALRVCAELLDTPTGEALMDAEQKIDRDRMVALLNEDLAREYQAIIAYVIYSQTIKGAQYTDIAGELELHAAQELSHALQIAKQIDYFNGTPTNAPKEVRMSDKPEDMLRF